MSWVDNLHKDLLEYIKIQLPDIKLDPEAKITKWSDETDWVEGGCDTCQWPIDVMDIEFDEEPYEVTLNGHFRDFLRWVTERDLTKTD